MSGFILLQNQRIPQSVKTGISHSDLLFGTGSGLFFFKMLSSCSKWTCFWTKSVGLLAKYSNASRRASFGIKRALDFLLLCLATRFRFFATALNESMVFGGPCKLFFLVVSQCYSQICVITRYICLIYKMTASWQLIVWVSGMFLLALSEYHYQEAPAGSKGWPKQSHAGEPADSQNLHVKLFRAFRSPDCSVFTAISRKDTSVMSTGMPWAGLQSLFLRVRFKL